MASGPAPGTEMFILILVTLLVLSLGVKLVCVKARGKHCICPAVDMFRLPVT